MRAVVEGRLDPGADAFQEHMDRCLGCRACETVCPSGVEYGPATRRCEACRYRSATGAVAYAHTSARIRFGRAPGSGPVGGQAATAGTRIPDLAARVLPNTGLLGKARLALAMLAASAPARFPVQARAVGNARNSGGHVEPTPHHTVAPTVDTSSPQLRVALLSGCVQEGLFGRVNRATERVLQANGYEVVPISDQGCCGALHAHAGHNADAKNMARANVDAFTPSIISKRIDAIVVNAAGCGAAMSEYGHLLADDPEYAGRAAALSERVRDVSELLAARGPRQGGAMSLRVTYDSPCHLEHAQGIVRQPLAVLEAIPGLDRVTLDGADECCGGAGILRPDPP